MYVGREVLHTTKGIGGEGSGLSRQFSDRHGHVFVPGGGNVFYAPLWHPALSGSTFTTIDTTGYLCTVTGAVYGATGRTFDGDDKIVIASAITIATANPWTILSWSKPTGTINKWPIMGSSTDSCRLQYTNADSRVHFYSANGTFFYMDIAPPTNTWVNISLVCDGAGTITFFKNGSMVVPRTYANTALSIDVIGYYGLGSNYFTGTIGEGLIYTRALSAAEVLNHNLATKWRYK